MQDFICRAPDKPGAWLYKSREGHALENAVLINVTKSTLGGEVYKDNEEKPMFWHGLWAGPIEPPKGWNAKDLSEI